MKREEDRKEEGLEKEIEIEKEILEIEEDRDLDRDRIEDEEAQILDHLLEDRILPPHHLVLKGVRQAPLVYHQDLKQICV